MTTILDKTLKRELEIQSRPFILWISPEGFRLVPKGKRKGVEIQWAALVSGEAALAVALNASLHLSDPGADSKLKGKPSPRRTKNGQK
jgi:hypothetical protein